MAISAACAVPAAPVADTSTTTAEGELIIGALHVGSITDAGYNQAHHAGLVAMQGNLPNVELIEAENVPESADAERVIGEYDPTGGQNHLPPEFWLSRPSAQCGRQISRCNFYAPRRFQAG